ncbi:helix-turn-helix domain-containing protein [Lysinibacillus fusiformis]|uniref:helix-turn-helix domain-containing protein n=1 Tax=Lysinibacillus sp. PWR01 TaxID=3342384 RepID=UPI00372D6462
MGLDRFSSPLAGEHFNSSSYELGLKLKATRVNKQLSLEEVAQATGIENIETILTIEIGEFKHLKAELSDLAKYLDVPLPECFRPVLLEAY